MFTLTFVRKVSISKDLSKVRLMYGFEEKAIFTPIENIKPVSIQDVKGEPGTSDKIYIQLKAEEKD